MITRINRAVLSITAAVTVAMTTPVAAQPVFGTCGRTLEATGPVMVTSAA